MSGRNEGTAEAFVQSALAGTRLAQVRWLVETGSTNDDLALLAGQGADEQVLIADLQTAGRGRRDRTWEAPAESGILMSVLLRQVPLHGGFWAVGAVALAASQAIDEIIDDRCRLKWPNDVLIGTSTRDLKVAGVLAQLVDNGIIVGIGINANWPHEVPDVLAERGTSINRHRPDQSPIDRAALAADILQRAIGHLERKPEDLRARWKAQCATLGQQVRLELDDAAIVGKAVDIEADGSLQIEESNGLTSYQVGDIVHLRPAI